MKPASRVFFALLAACWLAVLVPIVAAAADTATVRILNTSQWDIHHFYMSPSETDDWGPDQLAEHVLESGSSFTLTDIDCDIWDIRVVDEDGDECEILGVALCDEDAIWKITDDELLSCEGWQ